MLAVSDERLGYLVMPNMLYYTGSLGHNLRIMHCKARRWKCVGHWDGHIPIVEGHYITNMFIMFLTCLLCNRYFG